MLLNNLKGYSLMNNEDDFYMDNGWGCQSPEQYDSYWDENILDDLPMDSDEPVEAGTATHCLYYM
jgi:hypothetical protein